MNGVQSAPVLTVVVDTFPLGYPRLAAWVDSDPNYAEYRRFGYLHHRCLLFMQDELAVLERELSELDAEDAIADPKRLKCRFRDNSKSPRRRTELLLELKGKVQEYGTPFPVSMSTTYTDSR